MRAGHRYTGSRVGEGAERDRPLDNRTIGSLRRLDLGIAGGDGRRGDDQISQLRPANIAVLDPAPSSDMATFLKEQKIERMPRPGAFMPDAVVVVLDGPLTMDIDTPEDLLLMQAESPELVGG